MENICKQLTKKSKKVFWFLVVRVPLSGCLEQPDIRGRTNVQGRVLQLRTLSRKVPCYLERSVLMLQYSSITWCKVACAS